MHLLGRFEPQVQVVESDMEIGIKRQYIPKTVYTLRCEFFGKISKSRLGDGCG